MKKEIKRIVIEQEICTDSDYSSTNKPIFSTLGSFIEISTQGPVITFVPDEIIRDLLRINKTTICEEYNLSTNPVDNLSFDNSFFEYDIAQGLIFKRRRLNIIINWTTTVDPSYECVEKFAGGLSWYMMESKDKIFSFCFRLINENNQQVSFNGQSISFRLSIKEN